MIGSSVSILDLDLISFFYSDFRVVKELEFSDRNKDIIWIGKRDKASVDRVRAFANNYIIVGVPDKGKNFEDKYNLLEWVYATRFNKSVPKKVLAEVDILEDKDFIAALKVLWVSGKWLYDDRPDDLSVYSLFVASTVSFKETVVVFNRLLEYYHIGMVESSFLKFLSRVADVDNQSVSGGYRKLLNKANASYGAKVKPLVLQYAMRNSNDIYLNMIDLFLKLRG